MTLKTYEFRIYPTKEQEQLFLKANGLCRLYWNTALVRKQEAYKDNLVKVNPRNTSKTCHCCGYVNPKVKIGINYWKCPVCGESHDRDINAALNILHKWNATNQDIVGRERAESTNACGAPSSAVKHEVFNPSSRSLGS